MRKQFYMAVSAFWVFTAITPVRSQSLTEQENAAALENFTQAYVRAWEAAVAKYSEYGADKPESALSLFATGIFDYWSRIKDHRLDDPRTAPEAIFAEALTRLTQVQASGRTSGSTPATASELTIEALNISLKAAKNERAKLLNYIANLESGGVAAVNAKDSYTRGWNEAMAQVSANPTPSVGAPVPSPSGSLTTSGSLTAPNDFAERRKAMADARKGPPMSAADRAALNALQSQADRAAHSAEMERQMRNLNTEIRSLGQ